VESFRGKIVDIEPESVIIELTGDVNKVKAFLNMMKHYGIIEIVRTGGIALQRGRESIYDAPDPDRTPVEEETK
jgi:acetolactate synthase-1/3 small subunit